MGNFYNTVYFKNGSYFGYYTKSTHTENVEVRDRKSLDSLGEMGGRKMSVEGSWRSLRRK